MFICDEMWNNVWVYGHEADIAQFKERFIIPVEPCDWDDRDVMFDLSSIHYGVAWNFRDSPRKYEYRYWFAFDTVYGFPTEAFRLLAELFPRLAFYCECIADNDRSMGYGWFNPPPGGDDFSDDYDVPKGYWDTHYHNRAPADQQRHEAVIEAHVLTLKNQDRNG